jgi:threonylcarbamoyladenosine tRNA methylthiotransferase MtaB
MRALTGGATETTVRAMIRLALHTLGCRTNQAELASIRAGIEAAGDEVEFVRWDEAADVYLLHTCSVTARAERQCRQRLHQAARTAPEAAILVSGCYAQLSALPLSELPGVVAVVGTAHRAALPDLILRHGGSGPVIRVDAPSRDHGLDDPVVVRDPLRTRAPLKVQEGCDRSCSYCVVPRARGPERSLPARDVLNRAHALARAKHPEIVLTGTHTGRWGRGLPGEPRLPELLDRLLERCGHTRFRLSSLDPQEVTVELLRQVRCEPQLCAHLHLSLQHVSPGILGAMGRPAGGARVVGEVTAALPGACIGVDVIAGFPGETDVQFDALCDWLDASGVAYLHPFRFSPRPGTAAASMPDPVPSSLARARVAELRRISEDVLRPRFLRSLLGQELEVCVERGEGDERIGVSAEFATVVFIAPAAAVGSMARVRVDEVDGSRCRGMLR